MKQSATMGGVGNAAFARDASQNLQGGTQSSESDSDSAFAKLWQTLQALQHAIYIYRYVYIYIYMLQCSMIPQLNSANGLLFVFFECTVLKIV